MAAADGLGPGLNSCGEEELRTLATNLPQAWPCRAEGSGRSGRGQENDLDGRVTLPLLAQPTLRVSELPGDQRVGVAQRLSGAF